MILNPTKNNCKLCRKCQNTSVLSQGTWDRCYKCGEIYSKRGVEVNEMHTLENIVLDTSLNTKNTYLNKIYFFLTA